LRALRGERANLDTAEIKAKLGDFCPVCRVPIDRALAEGCHISRILPDATAVAEEKCTVADQMQDGDSAIGACHTDIAAKKRSLSRLRQRQIGIEDCIDAGNRD